MGRIFDDRALGGRQNILEVNGQAHDYINKPGYFVLFKEEQLSIIEIYHEIKSKSETVDGYIKLPAIPKGGSPQNIGSEAPLLMNGQDDQNISVSDLREMGLNPIFPQYLTAPTILDSYRS